MKLNSIRTIIFTLSVSAVAFYNCGNNNAPKQETVEEKAAAPVTLAQTTLPQDVAATCTISDETFNAWFGGQVTENGFVAPANSVTFKPQNNCSFYTWSQQMFLWLTSPDKASGSARVLESPTFYTVSPVENGVRNLIPHVAGQLLRASANITKAETEEGQATDNVLLDRNGNLVYFITMVNDVYVAQLNMAAQDTHSVKRFPTTQKELNTILAFAKQNNIPITNPNVLAMELKTSWVKLEGPMNKKDYITMDAIIPEYQKQGDSVWILNGETKATLALVGMHIVGSAAGHPEMIWSTFEHRSNTPNSSYQYINTNGETVTVAADNSGQWLFNQNAADTLLANANKSLATFLPGRIKATDKTIRPSNTIRVLPWGSAYDVQPNPEDATPAAANSEVISINNAVLNRLAANDVRKNYMFIGSTWTQGGVTPNPYPQADVYNPTVPGSTAPGVAIGTSSLANSTMETDFQLTSPNIKGLNATNTCFSCHNGSLNPRDNGDLSHIFYRLMLGVQQKQPKK